MAKSDLLKEAIADAKAVKETALANAKIALEEAFAPRIHGMLSAKLSEELDDEDMEAPAPEPTMEHDVMYEPEGEEGMGAEMDMEAPAPEMDTEIDMEAPAPDMEAPADEEMSMEGMYMNDADENPADADSMMAPTDEDLELEAIIRELEEDLDEEITEEVVEEDAHNKDAADSTDSKGNDLMADASGIKNEEFNIDEIIEEILSEDEWIILEVKGKKNVYDIREAPSIKLTELLKKDGSLVDYSDPYVPHLHGMRNSSINLKSKKINEKSIKKYDLVLLSTDHDLFDYKLIKNNANIIVDTRGVYQKPQKNIIKA